MCNEIPCSVITCMIVVVIVVVVVFIMITVVVTEQALLSSTHGQPHVPVSSVTRLAA